MKKLHFGKETCFENNCQGIENARPHLNQLFDYSDNGKCGFQNTIELNFRVCQLGSCFQIRTSAAQMRAL